MAFANAAEEAAYALDYGTPREQLSPAAQTEYDRIKQESFFASTRQQPRPAGTQAAAAAAQARPVAARYGASRRAAYGILWAGWTLILGIGSIAALASGQVLAGLVGLVLAGLAGRYDYRIWTWQAKRLLFLIIF